MTPPGSARRMVGLRHDDARSLFRKALVAVQRGDFTAAVGHCTQVLELDPEHVGALDSRGLAHYHLGDLPAALADFDSIVMLAPRFEVALNSLDLAVGGEADISNMICHYEQRISAYP